jgi:Carboxypeptidase regulatory-like domain
MTTTSWTFALLILAHVVSSRQVSAASLKGVVKDQVGKPIADAIVELDFGGQQWSMPTNDSGVYQFSGLPSGKYSAEVRSPGFHSFIKPVDLRDGERQMNVVLEVGKTCPAPRFSLIRLFRWHQKIICD